MPNCGDCVYWNGPAKPDPWSSGECRRHAPMLELRVRTEAVYHPSGHWPEMDARDWCGDYVEKSEPEVPEVHA